VEALEERWVLCPAISTANPNGPIKANQATQASTLAEAAEKALNLVNPTSQKEKGEYGGFILVKVIDGTPTYFASDPYTGTKADPTPNPITVDLPEAGFTLRDPNGYTTVGIYHTHAAGINPDEFHPGDEAQARTAGLSSFLATPDGQFVEYVPKKPLQSYPPTPEELAAFQKRTNWEVIKKTDIKIKTACPKHHPRHHSGTGGGGGGDGGFGIPGGGGSGTVPGGGGGFGIGTA
jgi:hypothetical protein